MTSSADDNSPEKNTDIVSDLFRLYPNGRINYVDTINQGLSGAWVFLVQIIGKQADDYSGLAFAKIDASERSGREYRQHVSARQGHIANYLPSILCEPIGPVGERSLILYQIAHNTLRARLLSQLVADHEPGRQVAAQVRRLVNTVLGCWHNVDNMIQVNESRTVPDLFAELMNTGEKDRLSKLEARALDYFGLTMQHEQLLFVPGNVILPNPLTYLLEAGRWKNAPRMVTPKTSIHGDLHGRNVICRVDQLDADPWLIDLARFEVESLPFFDLAYLELDLMLSSLPTATIDDWQNWLYLVAHLTRKILPDGDPKGDRSLYAWIIVQPIREYLSSLLQNIDKKCRGLGQHFEAAWWLAAATAGVFFGRRTHMERPGDRLAALLYAAYAQKHLNDMAQLQTSSQVPFTIQFIADGHPAAAHVPPASVVSIPVVAPPPEPSEGKAVRVPAPPRARKPEPVVATPPILEYFVGHDLPPAALDELGPLIIDAFQTEGYKPYFADPRAGEKSRLIRKWQRMFLAPFCIFEVSTNNPDIYIDLGIALSLNRPTLVLSRREVPLPPTLSRGTVIAYADGADLKSQLAELRQRGFPFQSTASNYCHFCGRICDRMSPETESHMCLVLNNSKLLWRDLIVNLGPYFQQHQITLNYLTDVSPVQDLCQLRDMVLSSRFALTHLGKLANAHSMLGLGMVIGTPSPWLVLNKETDRQAIPTNLQGLQNVEYSTLFELLGDKRPHLEKFLSSVLNPTDPTAKQTVMEEQQNLPIWEELKNWVDLVKANARAKEGIKSQGRLQIIWYEDERFIKRDPIYSKGLVFGREPGSCDVVISHKNISARHFKVHQDRNGKYYVEDLNSRNGTLLNGIRLQPNSRLEIHVKDVIRIQGTRIKLLIWDEQALPENIRPTQLHTGQLEMPMLRIVLPDIQPPPGCEGLNFVCILEALHPENKRNRIKFETQSYYPMGQIVDALAEELQLTGIKYHFTFRGQLVDDQTPPLDLGIGDQDILSIVLDTTLQAFDSARNQVAYCAGCQTKEHGKVVWMFGTHMGTLRQFFERVHLRMYGTMPRLEGRLPAFQCPRCHSRITETTEVGV